MKDTAQCLSSRLKYASLQVANGLLGGLTNNQSSPREIKSQTATIHNIEHSLFLAGGPVRLDEIYGDHIEHIIMVLNARVHAALKL